MIADDYPPLQRLVSATLTDHGIDVVALASDGEEALAVITAHRPQVAIVDLAMPGLRGVDVASRAARVAPDTGVILYTGYAPRSSLVDAVAAGALGFVSKAAPTHELVRAVEFVAHGEGYVDPSLASALVQAAVDGGVAGLSGLERDILRLLSEGRSDAAVGTAVNISADVVQTYVARAMTQLGVHRQTRAVSAAIRMALGAR